MSDLYIVHCVDTEGPLSETIEATFKRIKDIWGFSIKPTKKNLKLIIDKKINFNGQEDEIAELVAPELLNYNYDWNKINTMIKNICSQNYRNQFLDSYGNGWVYSWFCLDHVGYDANPRKRDLGYHKIFDRYCNYIKSTKSFLDGIHYHYHPVPFSKSAHHCATSYLGHFDTLYKSLSRKIIDRRWFPSVFRPGFNAIRPDSHWFLEQFIPFDFSNQSYDNKKNYHPDLDNGRFGDWRRAPISWEPYHPSFEDYQVAGNCKRLIFRCLNIGTRHRLLKQKDVDLAFLEAAENKMAVLSFTNHDYRDMQQDIKNVYNMLKISKKKFPKVNFIFSEAKKAVQKAMKINTSPILKIDLKIEENLLKVVSNKSTFGSQPFLAIKTRDGNYFHDNFDFQIPYKEWTYTFDQHTFTLNNIKSIGVASCDAAGNVSVLVVDDPQTNKQPTHRNTF